MATIIAASLQLQTQTEEAVEQLISAGFAPEKVTSFFVNPPGQHALYPIGGDHYQSPGIADEGDKNATFGTAFVEVAEAVIGVTHDAKHKHASTPRHRSGMLVAVELADQTDQDKAVAVLTQLGASNIEKAEGEIHDGEWRDFDPLSEPCYL